MLGEHVTIFPYRELYKNRNALLFWFWITALYTVSLLRFWWRNLQSTFQLALSCTFRQFKNNLKVTVKLAL